MVLGKDEYMEHYTKEWWRGACFYQIYPRSFYNPENGKTGTLCGITEKLPYVSSLGVDGIWISPFFKSPMKDFGYDVSDYRDIDPMFGTLDDFDELLATAHSLNLKIVIDLVLSHTSDQHPWFNDPDKKDMYVWADGKNGGPPNNWVSVFGGSAWEYSKRYDQYYLHNFLKEQPDLNFHNPMVVKEMLDVAKFWLDRGVDGFRLDVVNFYYHDPELRDNPPRDPALGAATQFEGDDPYSEQAHIYDKSRPENLVFIEKLRALMDQYDDRFTIGEIGDDDPYTRSAEYTAEHKRLNTTYNTHMMGGVRRALTVDLIKEPVEKVKTFRKIYAGSYPSWAFSNHDVVRAVSRWLPNSDGFSHNPDMAKMLIALLGCLRGCIFLYQGEELGLPEAKLTFEQLQDPWGIALWPEWQGRDGCRTPMPWNEKTPTDQWLPVPDEHLKMDVESQDKDENSVLNFTRTFLKNRKTMPALLYGDIEFIETGDKHLLCFLREFDEQSLRCTFNLSEQVIENKKLNDVFNPFEFRLESVE